MIVPAMQMAVYRATLESISGKAAEEIQKYMLDHNFDITEEFLDYADAIVSKYGEAAGALSAQFYDDVAEYWTEKEARRSMKPIKAAEAAEVPTEAEIRKTVYGTLKESAEKIPAALSRLVKRTAEDTTLHNAIRDGAEFAWVPAGDTCAFCIMLASRGWQRASKKALKNGHAEHIHANCDCTYTVRFDGKSGVAGYDPDRYLRMYENANGGTWQQRVNDMRREIDGEHREEINARKRIRYAEIKEAARKQEKELIDLYQKYGSLQNMMILGTPEDMMNYSRLTGVTGLTETEIRSKMFKEPERWESLLTTQTTPEMKRQTEWLLEKTTDEELSSLSMWTGETFGNINKMMRYGAEVDPISAEAAKNIESVLDRARTYEDMIVKRGTGTRNMFAQMGVSWGDDPSNLVGKIWKDDGFVATTPHKNGGFGGPGKDNAELFILLPKGTHAVYIESASHLELEREMLIQRGYSYRIVKAEYRDNPYPQFKGEKDLKLWVELIQ